MPENENQEFMVEVIFRFFDGSSYHKLYESFVDNYSLSVELPGKVKDNLSSLRDIVLQFTKKHD